jgi:serine phosphatase RsbU (regulator of sigma subunit)
MEALEVQAAVAKIGKYATGESGDTVEMVERPHGGISLIVVDGQRSGRSAKTISNLVARKAMSLLAEGVRDGAVARATHDYLRTHRRGQVSAELNIVSIDLVTKTIVISRNSRCPVLLRCGDEVQWLDQESEAVGIHPNTKPAINEIAIQPAVSIVVFTDGISHAGARHGGNLDVAETVVRCDPTGTAPAQQVADSLLNAAVSLDRGRPQDDTTVLVVKILAQEKRDEARRMVVTFPI